MSPSLSATLTVTAGSLGMSSLKWRRDREGGSRGKYLWPRVPPVGLSGLVALSGNASAELNVDH